MPDLFYAPFIGQTVTNSEGHLRVPRRRHDPERLLDVPAPAGHCLRCQGRRRSLIRANAGLYYARIPGLNLASSRSTDGSRGQSIFRNSAADSHPRAAAGLWRAAAFTRRRPVPARTSSSSTRISRTRGPSRATVGYEQEIVQRAGGRAQLHPRAHRPPDPLLQRQRSGLRRRCATRALVYRAWPAGNGHRQRSR